ncbi:MAG: putative amidophosphoribosyltransferase [Candidatus Azotimanducaceae bacterium]|jgi:predicted amidophosphoribosyltransferase
MEIAQVLTEFTRVPTLGKALRRVNDTQAQKQLGASDRVNNIRDAFCLDIDVSGKNLAIVDDVVTTGATVAEITRKLKANGAADVQVICLARTPANLPHL